MKRMSRLGALVLLGAAAGACRTAPPATADGREAEGVPTGQPDAREAEDADEDEEPGIRDTLREWQEYYRGSDIHLQSRAPEAPAGAAPGGQLGVRPASAP